MSSRAIKDTQGKVTEGKVKGGPDECK